MRAAVFRAVGEPLAIEVLPDPEPRDDEVIIRVERCGVCGTDLHSTSGHGRTLPAGSQLGHEYAGEVVSVGRAVTRFRLGDRLAGFPFVGCGHCEYCQTGIDALCRNCQGYDAGLAEYARVNERGAVKLPATLSAADGALVEPLAVGLRGVRLADPKRLTRVLVIGPGPIGLSVFFWLQQAGVARVAVLASTARRRPLARAIGVEHFIVEGEEAAREIHAALGGPPDIVFDCAGVPGVIARAIKLVRPQGNVVSLGFCMSPDTFVPGRALMKDVNLRFSLIYTREDFVASAAALDADSARAQMMVTDVVGLEDAPAAFEAFRVGATAGGKLSIDPWAGR